MSESVYRIKALEWVERSGYFEAVTMLGGYMLWVSGDTIYWHGPDTPTSRCTSVADGKAQAEAHWRARIGAALEEMTAQTPTAQAWSGLAKLAAEARAWRKWEQGGTSCKWQAVKAARAATDADPVLRGLIEGEEPKP